MKTGEVGNKRRNGSSYLVQNCRESSLWCSGCWIGKLWRGAHGFKPKNPSYKEVWHTSSLYHLVHTAALLAAPITTHPNIFGGLLSAGILAFSGTCYTVAYLEDRNYSGLAPFGGFAFIAAWATLLF